MYLVYIDIIKIFFFVTTCYFGAFPGWELNLSSFSTKIIVQFLQQHVSLLDKDNQNSSKRYAFLLLLEKIFVCIFPPDSSAVYLFLYFMYTQFTEAEKFLVKLKCDRFFFIKKLLVYSRRFSLWNHYATTILQHICSTTTPTHHTTISFLSSFTSVVRPSDLICYFYSVITAAVIFRQALLFKRFPEDSFLHYWIASCVPSLMAVHQQTQSVFPILRFFIHYQLYQPPLSLELVLPLTDIIQTANREFSVQKRIIYHRLSTQSPSTCTSLNSSLFQSVDLL